MLQVEKQQQNTSIYEGRLKVALKVFQDNIDIDGNGNGWQLNEDKNGYKIHTKLDPETQHTYSRGEGVLPYNFQQIFDVIDDAPNRGAFDSMFEKGHVIEEIEKDTTFFVYQKFKSILLVSSRDFVLVVKKFWSEDKSICTIIATSYPEYNFPEVKSTVRGNLIIAGYILKKLGENQTQLAFLTLADPKGSIPKKIVGMMAKTQGEIVQKVKEVIDKKTNKK